MFIRVKSTLEGITFNLIAMSQASTEARRDLERRECYGYGLNSPTEGIRPIHFRLMAPRGKVSPSQWLNSPQKAILPSQCYWLLRRHECFSIRPLRKVDSLSTAGRTSGKVSAFTSFLSPSVLLVLLHSLSYLLPMHILFDVLTFCYYAISLKPPPFSFPQATTVTSRWSSL